MSIVRPTPRTLGRPFRTRLLLVVIGLTAIGCDNSRTIQRLTPTDADVRARAYLAQLGRGQVDSAAARLTPSLQSPVVRQQLANSRPYLTGVPTDSMKVLGANITVFGQMRRVNIGYEMHTPRGWVVANVATVDTAGTWMVESFSAAPIPQSLESISRFTLSGRTPKHYLWLAAAILCFAFSVGTALYLVTRGDLPSHLIWAMVALVGVGAFRLEWTTGATLANLWTVQLGSMAMTKPGPAASWVVTVAFPLGAIAALVRYQRWKSLAAHQDSNITTP